MCKPDDKEQPSTEAPKRKRRKYRSQKLGAAGFSARMAKRGSFKTSWESLFFDIKGRG
ncbi:hypothetical protein [Nitrosomonas sp. JL21]|uniref:hypothetical protein n=1 Tax=Nitrosomonas sp. JL21 TaxID=153949 RepID=UPI00136BA96E|nr:hypothetical protein [Nitrosomonas sp. JL21]